MELVKGKNTKKAPPKGYHIQITLQDVSPKIWREVVVSSDMTLDLLHLVLQIAMGWLDCHLHAFIKDKKFYSIPDDEDFDDYGRKDLDSSQYAISDLLSKQEDFIEYMYDMGDGWEHKIKLKKIVDESPEHPFCIGGARACPPEDVGGSIGYENFLAALNDPEHDMHEEYIEWVGGEFDPEAFDLEEINDALEDFDEMVNF